MCYKKLTVIQDILNIAKKHEYFKDITIRFENVFYGRHEILQRNLALDDIYEEKHRSFGIMILEICSVAPEEYFALLRNISVRSDWPNILELKDNENQGSLGNIESILRHVRNRFAHARMASFAQIYAQTIEKLNAVDINLFDNVISTAPRSSYVVEAIENYHKDCATLKEKILRKKKGLKKLSNEKPRIFMLSNQEKEVENSELGKCRVFLTPAGKVINGRGNQNRKRKGKEQQSNYSSPAKKSRQETQFVVVLPDQ